MRPRQVVVHLVVMALFLTGLHPAPATAGSVTDQWSSVGEFRTADGWYASPVHASMLTDGRVLFIGIARAADPPTKATAARRVAWVFTPPPVGAPVSASTTIAEIPEPAELTGDPVGSEYVGFDDLVCMGAVQDRDGAIITAGGTRALTSTRGNGSVVFGIPYLTTYTGASWSRTATMAGIGPLNTAGRWYPTLTRLPTGKILITGGLEQIDLRNGLAPIGTPNSSIETYDPKTGAQQVLEAQNLTPWAIHASDYTHVFLLPRTQGGKDLVMFGENGVPVYGSSTEPNSFAPLGPTRPGGSTDEHVNYGASDVMLPLRVHNGDHGYANGSVLTVSGNMGSDPEHSADVFDPATASWRSPTIDLGIMRHHPSTVLLPDGRVLVLNGHDMDGGLGVEQAQYLDPADGFSVTTGTASAGLVRGYHSVAVLLPDGRVLVAGGRDQIKDESLEKPSYQIYTPTYPVGEAPVLTGAPARMSSRQPTFQVTSTGPAPHELVLVALGSMTHSIDMGEREIQLKVSVTLGFSGGTHTSIVRAYPNSHVAPPGYYWLFAVSAAGVPSTAKLVHVG